MRYLPLTDNDRQEMLDKIGVSSVDAFFENVPQEARVDGLFDLPNKQSEMAVEKYFQAQSARNIVAGQVPFFIGAGAYRHHVPSTVDYLIQRGEFLTSYTPYQPEITQGTLMALFEFQTQVAAITGMEVANASLYDGSTGCNEAVMMANRVTRRKKAVLSGGLHPQYRDIVECQGRFSDFDVVLSDVDAEGVEDLTQYIADDVSCLVVQNPSFFGHVRDLSKLAEAAHEKGVLLVVVFSEVVSLGAIKSPGEMGADIVVGEGQSIGNSLNFGGPYLGLFATKQKYIRQMPGRVCGETKDKDGKRGFVLTLSTREQHIRREKATSNICTNAGLCATAFTIHMTLLGEKGFKQLAKINHAKAVQLSEKLTKLEGVELVNETFFNEFTIRLSKPAAEVVDMLADQEILAGVPVSRFYDDQKDLLLVAATETCSEQDMDKFVTALGGLLS